MASKPLDTKNMNELKSMVYSWIFNITNKLTTRYKFINLFVRAVNIGRKLYLVSVLRNIFRIKATFTNWPIFVADCFGWIKKGYIIYLARNGIKYKVRANTIDVGVLYENIVLKNYLNYKISLKKGDVIIDIGSHIGSFSLLMASYSKDIIIYAIEPQKDNFRLLSENIKLNKLRNIIPLNTAILSTAKRMNFYENNNNVAGHTFFPHDKKGFRNITLHTTTLRYIVDKFSIRNIRFLKMDCEGSEYDILLNCPNNILKQIHEIALEFHRLDSTRNEKILIKLLKRNGFSNILISSFPISILNAKKICEK